MTEDEMKQIRQIVTEVTDPISSEIRTVHEELSTVTKGFSSELRSVHEKLSTIERRSERLDLLEERVSLFQASLSMLRMQQQGAPMPGQVRRVPGGYGQTEPANTWRKEHPYNR